MKYGIFTKPIHVEKIVNFLNQHTDLDYVISTDKQEIYAYEFDIGVSYCFPFKVDIKYGKRHWYNYHPGPLPEYPGLRNYVNAIADKKRHYGVALHEMTEEIDKGAIIKVFVFPLASLPVSTNELGNIAHYWLFQLFKETIEKLQDISWVESMKKVYE